MLIRSLFSFALALSGVAAAPTGKWFDKFVFIILENESYGAVYSNPYFQALAATGVLQTNYHAVAHPSQPNCESLNKHLSMLQNCVRAVVPLAQFLAFC